MNAGRAGIVRIVVYGISAMTALATGPLTARALGPAERGDLAAVLAPLILLMTLMGSLVVESVSAGVARGEVRGRSGAAGSMLAGLTVGVCLASVMAVAAPLLGGPPELRVFTLGLTLFLPPLGCLAGLRGVRQGRREHGRVTSEFLVAAVARLLIVVALFVAGALTLKSSALGLFCAVLILPVVILNPVTLLRGCSWSLAASRSVLRSAIASLHRVVVLLPGYTANVLNGRVDQILLISLVSDSELGFYVVAVSVAEVPQLVAFALRQIVLSEAAARRDAMLVATAARILFAFMLLAALISLLAIPPFVRLVFGPDFSSASVAAQILVFGTAFMGLSSVLGAGLISVGRPGATAIAYVSGLAVTLLLLPPLARDGGITGAAVASVVSYAVVAAVMTVTFSRITHVAPLRCLVLRREDGSALARQISSRRRRVPRPMP